MFTLVFASGKFVGVLYLQLNPQEKIKYFEAKLADSEKKKKLQKSPSKSVYHYVFVWDKEIPPSDQHDSSETRL